MEVVQRAQRVCRGVHPAKVALAERLRAIKRSHEHVQACFQVGAVQEGGLQVLEDEVHAGERVLVALLHPLVGQPVCVRGGLGDEVRLHAVEHRVHARRGGQRRRQPHSDLGEQADNGGQEDGVSKHHLHAAGVCDDCALAAFAARARGGGDGCHSRHGRGVLRAHGVILAEGRQEGTDVVHKPGPVLSELEIMVDALVGHKSHAALRCIERPATPNAKHVVAVALQEGLRDAHGILVRRVGLAVSKEDRRKVVAALHLFKHLVHHAGVHQARIGDNQRALAGFANI
mmetsp:Transcript_16923/g.43204  ORF Transcript_16923/g.43204 Transcript_16923/m.43204 type:complete len:287 (-) Transcript_16923:232-1092(-)